MTGLADGSLGLPTEQQGAPQPLVPAQPDQVRHAIMLRVDGWTVMGRLSQVDCLLFAQREGGAMRVCLHRDCSCRP